MTRIDLPVVAFWTAAIAVCLFVWFCVIVGALWLVGA